MDFASIWESIADAIPAETALIHGQRAATWSDFDDRAARIAAGLSSLGVTRGTTIAIDLYNGSEYLEIFFATLKSGATPANVNFRYQDDELHYLLADADAEVLFFHASLAERVIRVAERLPKLRLLIQVQDGSGVYATPPSGCIDYEELIRHHDPAPRANRTGDEVYLSYTGGTTGMPKGVMYNLQRVTKTMGLDSRDLLLGLNMSLEMEPAEVARTVRSEGQCPIAIPASPLVHGAGLAWGSLPALTAGGTVVTLETRSFDARVLLQTVESRSATMVAIVGDAFALPMVAALNKARDEESQFALSSLRFICSGGAAWSADVKRQLFANLPNVTLVDGCGFTEGGTYGASILKKGDKISTNNFQRVPGTVVLDEDGSVTDDGQVGLLAAVAFGSGYYKDPERTALVYRTIDGIEYVAPGDYGRIEPDGTVTLLGRGSAVINTGGEKVYPNEVESCLKQLPAIVDCVVIGTEDAHFGSAVTAVVELRDGFTLTLEEVRSHCKGLLAGYKAPRKVVFSAIPRIPTGKPDYGEVARIASNEVLAI